MITLTAGTSKAEIVPEMGGGLAGLWAGDLPVLRPWPGKVSAGPFALSCNLLVPFSNRISGGGFTYDGRQHVVQPNLPGEPYPIHGDGFQRAWNIAATSASSARLILTDGVIGPFRYSAEVTYTLTPHALNTGLAVTSLGEVPLPFGLGLHPWFPRNSTTRLRFNATGIWPETPDHLPATCQPQPLGDGTPWRDLAPLPDSWINAGFSGWDGHAWIDQTAGAAPVHLVAAQLGTALVYSPSANADFFCFEPVSHPVDAHNLPGQPGLVRLAPGETLSASMTLNWGHDMTTPQTLEVQQ